MNKLEHLLEDYLSADEWGKTLKNPVTGEPNPISGDRVKKLLPRINPDFWIKLGGKYYIHKKAEDPRQRDPDTGEVHWGVMGYK